jgi:hypothetical protein
VNHGTRQRSRSYRRAKVWLALSQIFDTASICSEAPSCVVDPTEGKGLWACVSRP